MSNSALVQIHKKESKIVSICKIESLIDDKQTKNAFVRKIFLMCRSCYWCASCLANYEDGIVTCPICGSDKMEMLPISFSEGYRFDHDEIRRMVLQFWTEIEGDIPT
jgi:hypothetical protein